MSPDVSKDQPGSRNSKDGEAKGDAISPLGFVFMTMLALQYGLQPFLQKACIPRDSGIDRGGIVLAVDLLKAGLCLMLLISTGTMPGVLRTWTLSGSLRAAAFPAVCYALQNYLAQVAYQNLDSLTFNLLNQTKTLSAAACLYLVMGKQQSHAQLVALAMLLVAALLLNGQPSSGAGGEEALSWQLGVLPILVASFLSGLSGAVTQSALQKEGRNTYLLSCELALYSAMAVAVTSLVVGGAKEKMTLERVLTGWTPRALLPVLTQAAGGIVVGQVTKHAGSVRKGFALIAGILVTAGAQWALEGQVLSHAHYASAVLVASGTWLHARYPHHPQQLLEEKKRA
jgi:UDP-sugar transporter A1/2/3